MKVTRELTGAALREFGFIHVTGLRARRNGEHEHTIVADVSMWGKHCVNNGMEAAITTDGETWLRAVPPFGSDSEQLNVLLAKLCPNRGNVFVPCSNGETIHGTFLFKRVANPFWDGEGRYPAEQRLAVQLVVIEVCNKVSGES